MHVLVRHGADRHQAELHRLVNVGRALEVFGHFARQALHHLVVPGAGKAAAHAEVGKLERVQTLRLGQAEFFQQGDLGAQALAAFGQRGLLVEAAEVQLVDDVQHVDLEAHHVHLRTGSVDHQRLAVGTHVDELALEAEHGQKIDKVALDVTQRAQVVEFLVAETHRTQVVELALDFFDQLGQRIGGLVTADKLVLGVGVGMAVQQGLPHGEFV